MNLKARSAFSSSNRYGQSVRARSRTKRSQASFTNLPTTIRPEVTSTAYCFARALGESEGVERVFFLRLFGSKFLSVCRRHA